MSPRWMCLGTGWSKGTAGRGLGTHGGQYMFLENRSTDLEGAQRCRIAILGAYDRGVVWTEASQEHPTPKSKKKGFID